MGKRTAKLVREAIVLGFVEGAHWGGYYKGKPDAYPYPKDSEVEERVFRAAQFNEDLYPTLSKAEKPE